VGSDELPPGELIYAGEISFGSGVAEVGNYLASDLHLLAIQPGTYGVRVYREPESRPAELVRFVIDGPLG
jgi:hypothetical protein